MTGIAMTRIRFFAIRAMMVPAVGRGFGQFLLT